MKNITTEYRRSVEMDYKLAKRMRMMSMNGGILQMGLNLNKKLKQSYYKYIVLSNLFLGCLFGFFVLSSLGMVIEHLTHTQMHNLVNDLRHLYLLENMPWLILFTIIGGTMGIFYGLLHKRILHLQEQLYHKEKLAAIGELSAGVAHEINTPLTNIALLAENIGAEIDNQNLINRVHEIEDQVQAASTIVTSLLEFSKKTKPELLEVDVNELINHTLDQIKNWKRKDVDIRLNLSNPLPLVKGDHGQLEQVFLNIIKNAYDALPGGGNIVIMTKKKDKYVQIEFRDSGMGIPKDRISKLFDPFYTTKENGIGLGLSICYGIIDAHDGRIVVQSKKGKGTVFKVMLQRWN